MFSTIIEVKKTQLTPAELDFLQDILTTGAVIIHRDDDLFVGEVHQLSKEDAEKAAKVLNNLGLYSYVSQRLGEVETIESL